VFFSQEPTGVEHLTVTKYDVCGIVTVFMGSCMFCCLCKGENIAIVHFGKLYDNAYKDLTYI
jgi:hypothetical protein